MKERLLVIAFLAVLLVALPAVARGSASHATSNSQTFPGPSGQDPNAPDISSIQVSNDNGGNLVFRVNITNRPSLTPDMAILVFLDTDQNAKTGDPKDLGADYVVDFESAGVLLLKWNGTTFVDAPSQASLTASYGSGGATVDISAADLGGTKGIKFGVETISGIGTDASGNADFTNAHESLAPAPGNGFYPYKVITKLTLTQTGFATSSARPAAGSRFAASLAAAESDTSSPVAKATITCGATVEGTRLTSTHSLANGVATCFWTLPRSAKGKTLVGKVSVTVQGTTLTKAFSARIR